MDDLTTKLAEALRRIHEICGGDAWEYRQIALEALALYEQAKAQPVQDEREAFEREMRKVGEWGRKNLRRDGKGVYLNSWTAVMWMVWQARAAMAATPAASEPVVVTVERGRVWIKRGNQSFMLGYEADTDAEREWYAAQLRCALSGFTPDVKTAPAPDATPAPDPLFVQPVSGDKLWLWQDGNKLLAYRHEYPCYSLGGDPCTLGEPIAEAEYRESYDRATKENSNG